MEIHIVLCILSLYSVQAQDGTVALGGSIKVQDPDPFADPGGDPFANMSGDTGTIEQGGIVLPDRNATDTSGGNAQGDPMVPGADVGIGIGAAAGDVFGTISTTTMPPDNLVPAESDVGIGGAQDPPPKEGGTAPGDISSQQGGGETSVGGTSGDIMSAGGADPFGNGPQGPLPDIGTPQDGDQPAGMIGGVVPSIEGMRTINTGDQGRIPTGGGDQGRIPITEGTSGGTGTVGGTRTTNTQVTGQGQGSMPTQGQGGTVRRPTGTQTGTSSDRIVGGIGGGGFNRLALDRGACFEKCLRDKDDCLRPHNCTHYEHCYTSMETMCPCTLRPCPFGTLWSVTTETCEIASKVFCEDDPCAKDLSIIAYPSGINCKSYYICSEGQIRRSLPMCCNDFHSFSLIELRCVPDDSCGRIPCTVQSSLYDAEMYATTTIEPQEKPCPLVAERGNPNQYNYKSYRLSKPMHCGVGTVFDESVCTCVNTISLGSAPIMRPCEEIIFIDFSGSLLKNHKIGTPVYPTDTQTVTTKEGAKYGRFNGKTSVIEIPYFDGKPVKNFLARIRFYTDGKKGPDNQVLLSNCQSARVNWDNPRAVQEATLSPTLAIILNRKSNMLTFLGSTGETGAKPVVMQLPFKPNDWNNVEIMYDGRNLQARNRVLTASADAGRVTEEDMKPLEGSLGTFRTPLKIGNCDQNDGFYGYMDMIKIFECIPRRNG